MSEALPPSARGAPDVAAALVLPPDLGWSERPSYAAAAPTLWTWANIPASSRRVAAAVDGILSHAFPGAGGAFGYLAFPFGDFTNEFQPPASPFARSAVHPHAPDKEYDAFQVEATLPFGRFHDRNQLRRWFHNLNGSQNSSSPASFRDPAPHRPMVDSRWGDILDVLVADEEGTWSGGSMARKKQDSNLPYRVLVWANGSTTGKSRAAMMQHANAGGVVVVAVGSVGPADASLTGVTPNGEVRAVRAWRWSLNGSAGENSNVERGYFRVASIGDDLAGGVEVVSVSEPEGRPLIVRRAVGLGWVYTCLVPYFGADGLSAPALRLLDSLLIPIQPVSVIEGVPTLYWTSTLVKADSALKPQSRVAAISNNADATWEGKVQVRVGLLPKGSAAPSTVCSRLSCEDIWNGRAVRCEAGKNANHNGGVFSIYIPAHDLVIVKVSCT